MQKSYFKCNIENCKGYNVLVFYTDIPNNPSCSYCGVSYKKELSFDQAHEHTNTVPVAKEETYSFIDPETNELRILSISEYNVYIEKQKNEREEKTTPLYNIPFFKNFKGK